MKCPYCGSEVLVDTLICEQCGRDAGKVIDKWENEGPPAKDKALKKPMFSAPLPRGPSRPSPPLWGVHDDGSPRSYFSMMAGVLILLGGIAALTEAAYIVAFAAPSTIIATIPLGQGSLAALMVVYGLFAIVGGTLGIIRVYWPLVVLGAACSMAAIGWFYLSFLFGVISTVLLAKTREEFD